MGLLGPNGPEDYHVYMLVAEHPIRRIGIGEADHLAPVWERALSRAWYLAPEHRFRRLTVRPTSCQSCKRLYLALSNAKPTRSLLEQFDLAASIARLGTLFGGEAGESRYGLGYVPFYMLLDEPSQESTRLRGELQRFSRAKQAGSDLIISQRA